MRRLACLAVLLASSAAHASPLELHADLRVGAASGWGLGGAQKDRDFFDQTKGGTYGVCLFADGRQCEEWALFRDKKCVLPAK